MSNNGIPEKRKRGRPKQIKPVGENLVHVGAYITVEEKAQLDARGISITDLVRRAVRVELGRPADEVREEEIEAELQKVRIREAELELEKKKIQEERERRKKLETETMIMEKFPLMALHLMAEETRRNTPNRTQLPEEPDLYARRYGISLDILKFNSDFSGYMYDIFNGDIEKVAKDLKVRLVDASPERYQRIREMAEKEVSK